MALSEKQVEYVLAELDGYAKLRDAYTGAQVSAISSEFIHRSYCCCKMSCFDWIWHSDSLIPT